ncbi:MAG: ABC transporter ATP-binding protein [Gordonia sp. (in: high G+C Gram-positive bacteria)]|uniref:ABC transporter ATP-binding protein n=1 Tax=Gordonia sp. (in: high G+C Gram-positive bacteria) TaxID=84139 RepID=UPI0039E70842
MTLVATGLTRSFGKHPAVTGADLTLTPGRITGLVGPNGAGKTTLLLLLAGLLEPSSGTRTVDGEAVDERVLRARTGWMPDVFGTWDSLTPHEILVTFARLYGIGRTAAAARADELLTTVHLTEHATRPASELSRGQKQRLGLARALVNSPRYLLLDEPASGMDPRSRVELRDQLRAAADAGAAVLVSSHILTELEEMVDDVVLMTGGRTQVAGPMSAGWRLRLVGQPESEAAVVHFDDDESAARHLADAVAAGQPVAEFTRLTTGLEQAYLQLHADRT